MAMWQGPWHQGLREAKQEGGGRQATDPKGWEGETLGTGRIGR